MSTPKGVDIDFLKSTPSLPSPFEVYPSHTCGVDIGLYRRCSRVHTRPPRALSIGLGHVPPQQVYQVYLGLFSVGSRSCRETVDTSHSHLDACVRYQCAGDRKALS